MKLPTVKLHKKYKKLAIETFESERFSLALKFFSLVLKYDSEDYDAKIGAVLSDYAKEDKIDAMSLYDLYYTSIKLGESKENTYNVIIELLEQNNSFLDDLLNSLENFTASIENGVEYKEFLEIAKQKNSMREALEDIMFSSKLIIDSKEDMMSFIELLYKHNFKEEAMTYLENAITIYPADDYFEEKFKQILHQ